MEKEIVREAAGGPPFFIISALSIQYERRPFMAQYADIRNDWKKLLPFAAGILLCGAVVFMALSTTLLSKRYVQKAFTDNRVYVEVTDSIRSKAKKAWLSSDPPAKARDKADSIMQEVITEEAVRKEADAVFDQLYSGKKVSVDGRYLQSSISEKAHSYIAREGLSLSASETDKLIEKAVSSGRDTIDISSYTDKLPVSLSGGTFRAVLFTVLAAAALAAVYFLSEDRMKAFGTALLTAGGLVLITGMILSSAFKPDEMSLPLDSLTKAASALKSAVTSRCIISGIITVLAGGSLLFISKRSY